MRKMDKIQFQKSDLYAKEPLIPPSTNSIDDLKKEIKRLEQEIDYKFSTFTNISEQIERWVQEDESIGFMSPNSTLEELDTLISKVKLLFLFIKYLAYRIQ